MTAGLAVGPLVGVVGRAAVTGPVRLAQYRGRAAAAARVGVVPRNWRPRGVCPGTQRVLDDQAARQADAPRPPLCKRRSSSTRIAQTRATWPRRSTTPVRIVTMRWWLRAANTTPDRAAQTQITGDPGEGPETQTANDILADSQQELDRASAERDARGFLC